MESALTRQTIDSLTSTWTENVSYSVKHIQAMSTTGIVSLNLCSGVNMSAEAMRQQQVPVRQHIDVELDPVARSIANLHHNTDTTSLPQDILLITEKHILELFEKYGTIDVVVISTPCQDLSSANVNGTGLAGSESKLLWDALRILDIVKKINPHVKYIVENVWFKEKFPEAYAAVNKRIGHEPLAWDARDCSAANRKRYFWTNIEHEQVEPAPVDANEFIEGGARLVSNRTTAPCIMASHRCELCNTRSAPFCKEPHNHAAHHYMFTKNPVLIQEGAPKGRRHNRRSPPPHPGPARCPAHATNRG